MKGIQLVKRLSVALFAGLFISILSFSSSALAVKNGDKCSKIGATTVTKGVTFSCVQVAKKRVWRKGVASPKSTTTASTASTVMSTTTVASVPCANGGVCSIGDIGPGGGKVFYVSATPFTSIGSDCNTSCRYLESAPYEPSRKGVWAQRAQVCYPAGSTTGNKTCGIGNSIYSGDEGTQLAMRNAASAIGMGMANTNLAYSLLSGSGGLDPNTYAPGIAWVYSNNGKTDWHLPSSEELNLLYLQKLTAGIANKIFWSSTEHSAFAIKIQGFTSGALGSSSPSYTPDPEWQYLVQPIRAF